MDWLNNNSGAIQAFFGMLIFIVTTIYTIVTYKMFSEMKINRQKDEVPDISIRLIRRESTCYDIEISNYSKVEVHNLKFIEVPDLNYWKGSTRDIGFFKNGISYLGIGQTYINTFLKTLNNNGDIQNKNFKETKYLLFDLEFYNKSESSKKRKKYKKQISINLTLLANTSGKTPYEKQKVEELKKLNKNIVELGKQILEN